MLLAYRISDGGVRDALMPTERNAGHQKRQYVAALPTRAIRLTITWQLTWLSIQSVDIPAVRLSDTGQTSPLQTFRYRCVASLHRKMTLIFSEFQNVTRSSSGDEIANVNCFTTTSDRYYKVQRTCAKIMAQT